MTPRKPTRKIVAKRAVPVVRRGDPAMRLRALELAVSVSSIDSAIGYGSNQYGAIQGMNQYPSRPKFDAPANIVKTAEAFLAFLVA